MDFKKRVFEVVLEKLQARVETVARAMADAKEAAAGEEKSSAGDKYETARAMSHLQQEMNAAQLDAAQKALAAHLTLDPSEQKKEISAGALVKAANTWYYLSGGLGLIEVDGVKVGSLSSSAPVALAMMQKTSGDSVEMNGRRFVIEEIW